MLSRLRNMFRVPDLRNKIIFTLIIIGVYRIGAHLPLGNGMVKAADRAA